VALRAARLLTALAVVGLCAFTVSRGWSIVRFSSAKAGVAAHENRADAVRPWIAVPGLAGGALQASLADVADAGDTDAVRQRGEALSAILSVRPLASTHWLSLAGARLVSQAAYDRVLGALAMSSLTGANEGSIMFRRGIFGLVQWEVLPPDVRKRVIADLAQPSLAAIVTDQDAAAAKGVVGARGADARQEIAALLRAEGVSAKALARIGL
jgi:hypothetical protein